MALPELLSRLRLAPLHHHLRRSLSAVAPPPHEPPPPHPAPPPQPASNKHKLFVAGLSWSADERSLTDAFSSFGTVTEDGTRGRCSTKRLPGPPGRPGSAQPRELFDRMPVRDVVACSAAIYRSARAGSFDEAVGLFVGMVRAEVCPNSFTLVGASLAAAGLGDAVLTECIHGWVVKLRLDSNPFVRTALLDSYAKCGCPIKARALFGEMRDPGIVTWNAMISGLVHNDLFEEAVLVFKRLLHSLGPIDNVVTMISTAQACAGCGDVGLCGTAHAYTVKMGLDLDVSVTNSILGMYLGYASLEIGREIFRKIPVNNVVSWTMMMGFLLEKGHAGEVIHMFVKMRSNGIVPDMVAMVGLVQACALMGDGSRGKLVHNQIVIRGFSRELPVVNSLITMYSKCKDLSSARKLFDGRRDKSLVSWTAMVAACVENGDVLEGLDLFAKMRHGGLFAIDYVTLVTLLLACYVIAKFDLCVQLHGYSYKSGLSLYRPVLNTLMAVYGKCGYVALAQKLFDEMICRDTVSWNTMILSFGINGQGEEAITLFNEMEKSSEGRDSVTYLNTLLACSHSGLVDDGLIIFRRMINDKGINPCQEHIGCIVDMLARAGRLDEAAGVASLTDNKLGLNAWKALMGGGHLHSDMKFTNVAAEKVLTVESFDYGHVLLLSNTYASLGKFSAAESVRSCYTKQIAKKTLGLSSI
uniref:Pentatricopeptide repeat-containing protein n=1 Tax=Triticum urartu TaxID=4572 RepID=A0A8R7PY69_TRIUA